MEPYLYLMTASAAVVFSWSLVILFGQPIRRLIDLRREVLAQLLAFDNVAAPEPREAAITSRQIHEYDQAVRKLRKAVQIFRDLGSQLLAFQESEPALCAMIRLFGLDVVSAGKRLNDLAETDALIGPERAGLLHEIESALRATSPTRRRHSQTNLLLDYQRRFLQLDDVGFTV